MIFQNSCLAIKAALVEVYNIILSNIVVFNATD